MRRNPDEDPDGFGGAGEPADRTAGDDLPPVEVNEYDDRITVVADVPGADEDDIALRCDGRALAIRAATGVGPYLRRVDLPGYVDEGSANVSYNNGVLEVTLDRSTDPANIGFY